MANKPQIEYGDRDVLDEELETAISDILAAEAEAARILETAEETAKAARLDGSARERTLRDAYRRESAVAKEKAIASAEAKAAADCAKLYEAAQKQGDELVAQKKKEIDKIAQQLYKSLLK